MKIFVVAKKLELELARWLVARDFDLRVSIFYQWVTLMKMWVSFGMKPIMGVAMQGRC